MHQYYWGENDGQKNNEALTDKYNVDANVTKMIRKKLEACWKKIEKKKKKKKPKNKKNKKKQKTTTTIQEPSDRKERFRMGGESAYATVPDDPITQTIGDILQKRFDPLSKPYDDDADPHDKTHLFLTFYLRNLLALAVNFWVINHSLVVSCNVYYMYMTSAKREPSDISNYSF